MEDLLRVGVITSTHGIAGEVKVFPTTDDANRFKKLKKCILKTERETMELDIAGVKFFKNMVILKFKQFTNINEVEKFRNGELYVTRENAMPLEEGEYYICDLIGLKVVDEDGNTVGVISDVLQTAANDVFVVQGKGKKEILVPYIDDCVKNVSMEEKKVTVVLLPGMAE